VAGTSDTYTVVVTNSGPSNAANLSVVDTLPTQGLTNISSPSLPTGVTFNSTTDTWSLASLASGQSVTVELQGTVPSSASGATYANTATASAADAGSVSATDTDSLTTQAALTITKTDNDGGSSLTGAVGAAVPGRSITYTVVAANSGPSTTTGASVTDALALNPAISSDSWTASGSGGATGFSASGTGTITDAVTIPAGGSVTYVVVATIGSAATGTLSNTATATATNATTVTATDSDTLNPQTVLSITKTDGVTSVVAGTSDTYTIVVSNTGSSDATNVTVADTLPVQGLTNVSSPALPAGVTFHAGSNTWSLASLPAGSSVTVELAGTVPSGATGSTYVNTATASASDAPAVSASDSDTLSAHATLAVTQSDGVSSVVAGSPDTYTIVVSATGPSDASTLSVTDNPPVQGLTNVSSPALPAGVTFTAATDTWSLSSLAAGQSVTLELSGTVPSGATGSSYANTVTAGASDASAVSATDSDTLSFKADLTLTKTDNDGGSSATGAVGTAAPGTTITYTLVASDTGPSNVTGAEIYDPVSEIGGIASDSWTATGSAGAAGFSPSGSGDLDDIVSVPAGGSVTYTVVAVIGSWATGTLSNTVSITPSPSLTNTNPLAVGGTVTATDSDTLAQAHLTITNTDTVTSLAPGSPDTYTIVVSNSGPSTATSLSVTDALPTQGLTSPSSPSLPAGATFTPGSGSETWTLAPLASGQSVSLELAGTVPAGATGSTYSDTASASASDASAVSATDTDSLGNQGDATITMTDSDGGSSITGALGTAVAGTSITYTVVAANTGPSTLAGAETYNPVSEVSGITSDTWTATGTGGAVGFSPSGSGDIDDIVVIPAGGTVTYTVVATISSSASGTMSNTVSLTPPPSFKNTMTCRRQ
jgi:uncharacterized repeat protein (TIGR01451 family)